jgi:hypothetical protein
VFSPLRCSFSIPGPHSFLWITTHHPNILWWAGKYSTSAERQKGRTSKGKMVNDVREAPVRPAGHSSKRKAEALVRTPAWLLCSRGRSVPPAWLSPPSLNQPSPPRPVSCHPKSPGLSR